MSKKQQYWANHAEAFGVPTTAPITDEVLIIYPNTLKLTKSEKA